MRDKNVFVIGSEIACPSGFESSNGFTPGCEEIGNCSSCFDGFYIYDRYDLIFYVFEMSIYINLICKKTINIL